jgi:hypothetical protein
MDEQGVKQPLARLSPGDEVQAAIAEGRNYRMVSPGIMAAKGLTHV